MGLRKQSPAAGDSFTATPAAYWSQRKNWATAPIKPTKPSIQPQISAASPRSPRRRLDRHAKKLLGPPNGQPWVWLTTEMLASEAWRNMSRNGHLFVSFLLIEHQNHAGLENGRLKAPYVQLVSYGLLRKYIKRAIAEAVRCGFVEVMVTGGFYGPDGRHTPSQYRLTWLPCFEDFRAPTNEWRKVTPKTLFGLPQGLSARVTTGVTRAQAKMTKIALHRGLPTWEPPYRFPGQGGTAEGDAAKLAYVARHGRWASS